MLGELNASHMGYSYPPARPDANTRYLGIEIERDAAQGLYWVSHIQGPADKDYIDLRTGDYILEIDGQPLTAGENLYERLNNPLNEKVSLLVNDEPDKDGARTARIPHIDGSEQWTLFYKDWVRTNREHVEKTSGGRIGYLHIRSMSGPALDQFKKDIAASADKEALIVDVRYNGGGNIEQQLLDILERRRYQRWVPRDIGEEHRPHEGFFGPKVVLANESSASNAEMFPAGFRALGLGKVIGVPTTGAVIGTTSYNLIDGSSVRMPQVGVSLLDGTNMENLGIEPDILVEISPSDELDGKDPQLDAAVRELLHELETAPGTTD
jgi:tricorn protease